MRTDFLSPQQVVAEMTSDSQLSQARKIFSSAWAEITDGMAQRRPLSIIEVRNIEFDAVIKIAALFGVELEPVQPAVKEVPLSKP